MENDSKSLNVIGKIFHYLNGFEEGKKDGTSDGSLDGTSDNQEGDVVGTLDGKTMEVPMAPLTEHLKTMTAKKWDL